MYGSRSLTLSSVGLISLRPSGWREKRTDERVQGGFYVVAKLLLRHSSDVVLHVCGWFSLAQIHARVI